MGKLPIKRTKKLAEAERTGKLKADVKFHSKLFSSKKQLQIWLSDRARELIDKIDPLKLGSVLVITYLVKNGIEWTEELVAVAERAKGEIPLLSLQYWWKVLGFIPESEEIQKLRESMDMPQAELLQWLISFAVAYIIVEHAGELITAGGQVLKVAKGLLGMLG